LWFALKRVYLALADLLLLLLRGGQWLAPPLSL